MPSSQLVRTLPSHARYAKLSAELPPEPKRTPSMLAAELKGASRPAAALRRPRVIGLLNMSEFTHNTDSIVPLEEPLFQPSPPEVVFDAFECHEKYSMLLRFRNNDNVNRRLKVLSIESTVFAVEPPKGSANGSSKVAPGMEVAYKITFTPRNNQDYSCELVCLSEREKFLVSISARGPRACFEFPDGVDFGLQPVRANATEAFLLRNTGVANGRFVLSVPQPFSVSPSDGALKAGEALQLTFGFNPEQHGEFVEELLVEYDSGERCYARLSGASSDVEVGLERSLLVLEPCYISLLSQVSSRASSQAAAPARPSLHTPSSSPIHTPPLLSRRPRSSCTTARTSRSSSRGRRTAPRGRTTHGGWRSYCT
jgi:hydrocephalus-inducing protein